MTGIPEGLARGLAGRYSLAEVVGRGGMATVFRAVDLKHHRDVAVKVLRPDLAATLGAERFLREIEIAAGLHHPHILMLIDSGAVEDTFYYVMPYVEGASLRGLLASGPMELKTTVTLLEKVADALDYAHDKGLVHRDIKPENILMNGAHPAVADFGIAKAISTAGIERLTRTGFPIGTPGYMSPEQAAGWTDLDARSDVFSLACVAYEMLVGEVPTMWLSDAESDGGKMVDLPEKHRAAFDRLPPHVEAAIARALARKPDQRFAKPSEFVTVLDGKTEIKKRYSEGQVGEIVRHAAESQVQNPTAEGALTVGAIEEIAADVGIPAHRVRDAIAELEATTKLPAPRGLFSTSPHLELETTLTGEIPQSGYEAILDETRVHLKEIGRVNETMGRTLSWNSASFQNSLEGTGRLIHLSVSPRKGETRIRITETGGGHHILVVIGSALAGGGLGVAISEALGSALGNSPVLGIVTVAATVFGAYALGRSQLNAFVRRRHRKLSALLRKLANLARESIEDGDIRT
jgi:hypothetical protein